MFLVYVLIIYLLKIYIDKIYLMMYILLREIGTQNRNYWICNDCGYKFRNTEDWHEEIKKKEQAVKVNLVLTIFFIIVAMLLFTGGEVSSVVGIVFLIIGAVNAITFFLGKTRIRNELQHLDDLESSSME